MFGRVRVFVCVCVCVCVCHTFFIECSSQGAFQMVGHSKWLLFRKVAPSRSITLLIHHVLDESSKKSKIFVLSDSAPYATGMIFFLYSYEDSLQWPKHVPS